MFDGDGTNPGDQGAFNSALEYLKTLISTERELNYAFAVKNYDAVHELLDVLFMDVYEWLKDEVPKTKDKKPIPNQLSEVEEHERLRDLEHKAYQRYLEQKKKGGKIDYQIIEAFKYRYIKLKKVIHDKGLRMPHKDDPSVALFSGGYG